MLVIVGLELAGTMLVIVGTVLAPMLVVMSLALGAVDMLVSVCMLVSMAVLMRVLVGVSHAIVGVFVGVSGLVRVVVPMRVFVLAIRRRPHRGGLIRQRALAVRGTQHAIHGIGRALGGLVEVPHL